jgi:hypothetical protein
MKPREISKVIATMRYIPDLSYCLSYAAPEVHDDYWFRLNSIIELYMPQNINTLKEFFTLPSWQREILSILSNGQCFEHLKDTP